MEFGHVGLYHQPDLPPLMPELSGRRAKASTSVGLTAGVGCAPCRIAGATDALREPDCFPGGPPARWIRTTGAEKTFQILIDYEPGEAAGIYFQRPFSSYRGRDHPRGSSSDFSGSMPFCAGCLLMKAVPTEFADSFSHCFPDTKIAAHVL